MDLASNITQNFQSFISSIDFTSQIITLLISGAVKDLLNEILDQFVSPVTDRIMYQEKKFSIYGKEIEIGKIINKVISLLVILVVAFILHKYLIK